MWYKGHVTRSNFSCNLQRHTWNVALQVPRKNSRVTPHFVTAIVALRVARKLEQPLLFAMLRDKLLACNILPATCNTILSEWANRSSSFATCQRLSASAILFVIVRVEVAKKVANVWHPLCNLKGFLFAIVALQVARKIASCNMALSVFGCLTNVSLHKPTAERSLLTEHRQQSNHC